MCQLVLDRELIVLKAVAGEIDMQGRHIQFKNFPVLKEGEAKGNYRIFQYGPMGGIQAALKFNQTWDGPEAPYLENENFRIALSHAINRQEVNDILFFGLGEVRQSTTRSRLTPRGFSSRLSGCTYSMVSGLRSLTCTISASSGTPLVTGLSTPQ